MSLRAIMLSVEIWCQQDNATVKLGGNIFFSLLLSCWHVDITVKSKPHASDISGCSIEFRAISKDVFKSVILPALQRSMLRSLEVILRAIGAIVSEIQADLSDFAIDESGLERWNCSARNGRIPEAGYLEVWRIERDWGFVERNIRFTEWIRKKKLPLSSWGLVYYRWDIFFLLVCFIYKQLHF